MRGIFILIVFFFSGFVLFLSSSFGKIETSILELQINLSHYEEFIKNKDFLEASIFLRKLKETSNDDELLELESGHFTSLAHWIENERANVSVHLDDNLQAISKKEFKKTISQFEVYQLWKEDPESAFEYIKSEEPWSSRIKEFSKEGVQKSFNSEMEQFKNEMAPLSEEKIFEKIASPLEKAIYYSGLADGLYERYNQDCHASIGYLEKALDTLSILSKEDLSYLEDLGWSKKSQTLKLFHCYQALGEDEKAKKMYERLKQMAVQEVYVSADFTKMLETLKQMKRTLEDFNQSVCTPLSSVSNTGSQEIEYRDGKFCKERICYELPVGRMLVSKPFIFLDKVFQLGSSDGNIQLYVFNKETGTLIKKVRSLFWDEEANVNNPPIFSFISGKLYIHAPHTLAVISPYDLVLETLITSEGMEAFSDENQKVMVQLNKEQEASFKDPLYLGIKALFLTNATLRGSDENVRSSASWTLRDMGEHAKEALPQLASALSDPNDNVGARAAEALGRMGEHAKGVLPQLVASALSDPNDNVRRRAAGVLGIMGEHAKEALPQLASALSDPNERIRENAASALGRMGEHAKGVLPQLTSALSDPKENVRRSAAWALGTMGEYAKGALPQLVASALSDPKENVRRSAAGALRGMGHSILPELENIKKDIKDPNEQARLDQVIQDIKNRK